jgi:hypothetical protein
MSTGYCLTMLQMTVFKEIFFGRFSANWIFYVDTFGIKR